MRPALKPTVISASVETSLSATLDLIVPDSPWFDGHFTDHPVLPGIALVLWAKAAFEERLDARLDSNMPRAKFRSLVHPGAELQLRLTIGKRLAFAYHSPDGEIVCSGEFTAIAGDV